MTLDGGYMANGLHATFLRDRMPLDHWFHAFQTTFGEMVIGSHPDIAQLLRDSIENSTTYDYSSALDVYATCMVRPLNPGQMGDDQVAAAC